MPSSRTLFERLVSPDPAGERRVKVDEGELKESIRKHLQHLLNSRHGGSPSAPDYGTPEFDTLFRGGRGPDGTFARELAQCIMKYEPRLREVEVSFSGDHHEPFRLRFDIRALMVANEESVPTVFRSTVETSGKVQVSR